MLPIPRLSLARSLSLSLRSDNDVMMIKIFSLPLSHARARARSLSLSLSLSVSFSLIDVIMIMKMSALGGECERARGERKIRGEGGGAARNCFVLFACECAKMLRCAPARSRHNPACRSASRQGRVCKTSSRLLFMGCSASCLFMECIAGWPRPWRGVPAQPTVVLAIDSSEPDELSTPQVSAPPV